MSRAAAAGLLLALLPAWLGGCGVKAPPRASGASAQSPPNDLFRPAEDPNRIVVPAEEPPR